MVSVGGGARYHCFLFFFLILFAAFVESKLKESKMVTEKPVRRLRQQIKGEKAEDEHGDERKARDMRVRGGRCQI